MNQPAARILGWDLLRGVGALMVAFYHLSYWLGLAELPALGTYGVYLFFVLSGASLAYVYPAERVRDGNDILRFLATRWLRLAPLYLLLCVVFIVMLSVHNGQLVNRLPLRLALNATFAFGFWDPAVWALLIGGWTLGIEFVYYLFFPLMARVLRSPAASLAVLAALVAFQWWWIYRTVGAMGWTGGVISYHHVPAFAAYFFGGCMLGYRQRSEVPAQPEWLGWLTAFAWVSLLLLLMPSAPGNELLGLRGAVLFSSVFVAVFFSGRVRLEGRTAVLAEWFGDVTFGLYLLHPILVFGVLWFVAPDAPTWSVPARCLLLLGLLSVAATLAVLSERRLERPLRRWSQRRLKRAG
ncbi:acyltransferase [Ramlibacter sp. XY19]|uniref:acyltransferase family protein n=1 Tax=Ramlibacter paludis TaxID=2908000 RepID=UPI0023DA123A|nr:acyltransferase [Ramlibacter paludis]